VANAAIFIGWGVPVRGREKQANRSFGEAMQYFGRLQQQGEIESFEPIQLEPHGGDLSGCCIVRGDRSKLNSIRFGDEFQRLTAYAGLVVEHFGVVDAHIGEDLQRGFEQYLQLAEGLG
jgi:hypothetical protein